MSAKKQLFILGSFLTIFFVVANVYKNFAATINDLKYKFTQLKSIKEIVVFYHS